MGTIAEKLTYLNDTKQLLKESINNLGGNLTNEPFRQYASVLEGIYERLPKVSGIGASLSLSPSLMGKIKLNEIQGNTLQDGTPTPSSPVPIQSVTGLQNVTISNSDNTDSNTYEVNLGNIELNKIGTYQDRIYKDNGKWYVEKNTQTLKLNSTDYTWNRNTLTIDGTTYSQYYTNISDKPFANANVKCNYFINTSENVTNKFYYGTVGKNIVFVAPSVNGEYITSVADWKTWIDSINLEVYGGTDTPVGETITNEELINQLESLNNAKSEDGTTNINVTSEDLSMILNVGVIKGDA